MDNYAYDDRGYRSADYGVDDSNSPDDTPVPAYLRHEAVDTWPDLPGGEPLPAFDPNYRRGLNEPITTSEDLAARFAGIFARDHEDGPAATNHAARLSQFADDEYDRDFDEAEGTEFDDTLARHFLDRQLPGLQEEDRRSLSKRGLGWIRRNMTSLRIIVSLQRVTPPEPPEESPRRFSRG